MNKKIFLTIILGMFLISFASAIEVNHCCEKTISGVWCINDLESECDTNFRNIPTSCDATAYCRMGTCIDSQEGTCMENTPQRVCQDSGGVWEEGESENIPQCNLGCCLIGDQAAFVTQTRCKRLSSLYGLEINFRNDISSEISCIASATSDVMGACVFEKEFVRTCKFISKKECQETQTTNGSIEFHEGFLCSAESLGTNCGPTKKTICVEGKDEVRFVDSCGNLANIYDASKIKDKVYWTKVLDKSESCGFSLSNADSSDCGNCDYYLGSTCKKESGAKFGDNICKDLSCEWEGKKYQHGETWCANADGTSSVNAETKKSDNSKENLPGSRYFRLVCYNSDVTIEPCADFRQEVCIESSINDFSTAACRVNMWQDCYSQGNEKDCENSDRRDCQWINGIELNSGQRTGEVSGNIEKGAQTTGAFITGAVVDEEVKLSPGKGACVPLFAPGFNFWEGNSEANSMCSMASAQCVVTFAAKLGGKMECKTNCECLENDWEDNMNKACIAVGDCGSSINYIGKQGYHDKSSVTIEKIDEEVDDE